MNIEQSTDLSQDTGRSGPDYGRRNPLEIGVQLRNLVNRGDFLTVQYDGGHFVTRLLAVDVGARAFVFDWGAIADENAGVLAAPRCAFSAAPDGVRVEFSTGTPRRTEYDGLPAFVADFPDVLYYVQRREYFRVDAPIVDPYLCEGLLPDGTHFQFEVLNLSLGGIGVRTADDRALTIELGSELRNVELTLSGHGKLSLDLQLMSRRASEMPNGTRRYQLGFRFVSLPGSAENTLQRLITQLEIRRRQLTRS